MNNLSRWAACAGLAMAAHISASAQQAIPQKPPRPAEDVPDLRAASPTIVCGDCDEAFDTTTHKEVLEGLVLNKYVAELRRALYVQDTYHQFESKVHFDNCDFDGAIGYVDGLFAEIDAHVVVAKAAQERNDHAAVEASSLTAFFALGQALHGVQDFYAHTNYVEMIVGQAKTLNDIDVVLPWGHYGKEQVKELTAKGLISGYVFWGFPQRCPEGTPSHAVMAKDKASTPSGAVKVPHLENRSRYEIAVQLAREASRGLVDIAFRRWPLLKDVNGRHVAFEVLVDRREF